MEKLSQRPQLTVVLPVYNEEGNLAGLLGELLAAIAQSGWTAEVLIVDDASTDGSQRVAGEWAARDPRIRPLAHRRNFGQSAAFASGFASASGDWILTMDADGQHDPADLPRLIAALRPGVDAVCGFRTSRRDSWIKRVSSRVANRFRNALTGDRVTDAGCTFRLIRREALAEIPRFNGMHRFLPTLLRSQGYHVVEAPVGHRPRNWGVSKYGIGNRLLRGIVDCFAIRWWKRRAVPGRRLAMGAEKDSVR